MHLYNYQKKATEFIINNEFCALWLDCGLGKTVITLKAISQLLKSVDCHKILVIAPLRVATISWPAEIQKWNSFNLKYSLICGNQKKRIENLNSSTDLYLINTENVSWLVEYYKKNGLLIL